MNCLLKLFTSATAEFDLESLEISLVLDYFNEGLQEKELFRIGVSQSLLLVYHVQTIGISIILGSGDFVVYSRFRNLNLWGRNLKFTEKLTCQNVTSVL